MEYYRIKINIAIPLSSDVGMSINDRAIKANPSLGRNVTVAVGAAAPKVKKIIENFQDVLAELVSYAGIINEQDPCKEEPFAQTHICRNEENMPCINIEEIKKIINNKPGRKGEY